MRLLGCLFAACYLFAAAPSLADVPSVRDLGIAPEALAPVLGESQLVLIHKPRKHAWTRDDEKFEKQATFITSLQVIKAPVAAVRAVVTDHSKYTEFITQIREVEAAQAEKEGGATVVAFETVLNLMVMELDVDYTLAYSQDPGGDITWRLVEGDFSEHTGRWEFFSLPGGKTLLAYTVWQDFSSVGFTVRTIMSAQPDMKLIIPTASAAVLMDSVRRRVEGLPREAKAPASVSQATPRVPTLSGGAALPLPTIRRLAEAGTLMLIHPTQWFKGAKGKPTDFTFMSAGALVDMPADKVKTLATSFDRFPEFLGGQVDKITRVPVEEDPLAYDFKLKIGVSVFSIGVKYRLKYTEVTPLVLTYQRVSGEIEHVYGAWEFLDLGDGKSLIWYTTGNKLGAKAPAILKVGKDMPNRDLIIGVSATVVTIQKLLGWLPKQ